MKPLIMMEVNGKPHTPDMPEQCSVLQCLREELGLNGPKLGCGEGECGACTVLVDGVPQTSCNLPLWDAQGKRITTLEGLGEQGLPHRLQTAFIEENAGQCGYCLSGIITRAAALLRDHPQPSREQIVGALEKHLCRCGAHERIIRAIQKASA
jgi:nicotinate dehydrogenase subunit A